MSSLENQHKSHYNSSSVSIIGEHAVYRGDIEFEGVLHVNGDFYGNIKGDGDLGIGLTGRVRSVIHASNVIISGLVCGEIFALGRVAIKSSAIVIGDIQAATLVVEEGSIFHGRLEISDQKERHKIVKPGLLSSYREIKVNQESLSASQSATIEPEQAEGSNGGITKNRKDRKGKYSVWS